MDNTIGKRFRLARRQKGYSLKDAAMSSKITVGGISRIENGDVEPMLTTAIQLANAYGTSLNAILSPFLVTKE